MKQSLNEFATRYRTLFARNTRFVVVTIATTLALAFTVIQLKGLSLLALQPVITDTASHVIWRGSLILYFWCWRYGCVKDTDIQELAYASLPNKGKWSYRSYGIVLALILVASALLYAYGDIELFSVTLTIFFVVDHVGWRHLVRELAAEGESSRELFIKKRDYFSFERLTIVRAQIQGNWKWWRMVAGTIIIGTINAFAFIPAVRAAMISPLDVAKPGLSSQEAELFVYSLLVCLFVIVMEVWHYWIRLRTWHLLECIDDLSEKYSLRKKPAPPAPEEGK